MILRGIFESKYICIYIYIYIYVCVYMAIDLEGISTSIMLLFDILCSSTLRMEVIAGVSMGHTL